MKQRFGLMVVTMMVAGTWSAHGFDIPPQSCPGCTAFANIFKPDVALCSQTTEDDSSTFTYAQTS